MSASPPSTAFTSTVRARTFARSASTGMVSTAGLLPEISITGNALGRSVAKAGVVAKRAVATALPE